MQTRQLPGRPLGLRASEFGEHLSTRDRYLPPRTRRNYRGEGPDFRPVLTAETPEGRLAEFRDQMRTRGLAMTRDPID